MKFLIRNRRVAIVFIQALVILVALTAAYILRFDYLLPAAELDTFRKALWIALVVKLIVFRVGQLDRGWSRFIGIEEVSRILVINIAASGTFTLTVLLLIGTRFPRSVYGLDLLITFLITAAMHASPRIYHELFVAGVTLKGAKRVLIYGAGASGAALVKEIRSNPSLGYRVIGFLDDSPGKQNTALLSIPVLGRGHQADVVCAELGRKDTPVDEIVIAMPSATGKDMQEAISNCRAAGVACKTVPGVGELLSGNVRASQIREVSVLDLLGREPIQLDDSMIRRSIEGRSVMVTGGGGSIGSEIARQVARYNPSRLILFDKAESDLFWIHNQLVQQFPELWIRPAIGDIQSYTRVEEAIREYDVDSIFHAAAYKHVPMMEGHLFEAVQNNILGTRNIVYAASRNGVSDFLMISSDKAVNPTNVMGATKRAAELIVSAVSGQDHCGTKCVSVRFGNVLGSNGSVVPLFKKQILNGGPVTVTHPEMRRYFMTIPEAVQLVLQASTMGRGAEIFVLDMGEPVKIVDLARNMIRLSGHEPDVDIQIEYSGMRPGEKLFEELATQGEDIIPTYHKKIKIFFGSPVAQEQMEEWIQTLELLVEKRDAAALVQHLQDLLPEYIPSASLRESPAALAIAARAGSVS